jgi:hypothetical protein
MRKTSGKHVEVKQENQENSKEVNKSMKNEMKMFATRQLVRCVVVLISLFGRWGVFVVVLFFKHLSENFDELAGFGEHRFRLVQLIFQHGNAFVELLVLDQRLLQSDSTFLSQGFPVFISDGV